MDKTALFNLSYGLYVIGTKDGERDTGCIVNTIFQITSTPAVIAVSINKDNYTNPCVKKEKIFSVSILSEAVKEEIIGIFGFHTSKDTDKFSEVPYGRTPGGMAYVSAGTTGYLECRVIDSIDCHTHTVFLAEVQEAENLSKETPMTYVYYHNVIKGKAPKNAPTYVEEEKGRESEYICSICGYHYPGTKEEFEKLGEDYICPICKNGKEKFVLK